MPTLLRTFLLLLLLPLPACHGDTASPRFPVRIDVVTGADQRGLTGAPLPDSIGVRVRDVDGRAIAGYEVQWRAAGSDSVSPAVSLTDRNGVARTLWVLGRDPGPTSVAARAGDIQASIGGTAETGRPGVVYEGRNGYITYEPGTLPLVLSAPHGGTREPLEIPDRTSGTMVRDLDTDRLATALADALERRLGQRPHLVIDHLHRRKMDANRDLPEAAAGDPLAEQAWLEFQRFVAHAGARVAEDHGAGLYIDLHGHGHELRRVELGYLLSADELALPDPALDDPAYATASSIRALAGASNRSFPALLRGPESLGGLLQAQGLAAVPSPAVPDPDDAPYFTGGYNTRRHGSRNGGTVDGIQLEAHRVGVRDTDANRRRFADAAARAIERFLYLHYGWTALTRTPGSARSRPAP